jgi:DNA-directed RNA polymerase subunit RPC12/RpoP
VHSQQNPDALPVPPPPAPAAPKGQELTPVQNPDALPVPQTRVPAAPKGQDAMPVQNPDVLRPVSPELPTPVARPVTMLRALAQERAISAAQQQQLKAEMAQLQALLNTKDGKLPKNSEALRQKLALVEKTLQRMKLRQDELREAQGVPFLEDLPLMGNLFQARPTITEESGTSFIPRVEGDNPISTLKDLYVAEQETPLTVDMNDLPVREALKQILGMAKQEYLLDDDIPQDKRVTLKVSDCRLSTVLDLLTQAAGVGWRHEMKEGKTLIHVGKKVRRSFTSYSPVSITTPNINGTNSAVSGRTLTLPSSVQYTTAPSLTYQSLATERHSIFKCPHCRNEVTVIRKKQNVKCPKCDLVFQEGWAFCPRDGAKRPADATEWHYCPICGKQVEMHKDEKPK